MNPRSFRLGNRTHSIRPIRQFLRCHAVWELQFQVPAARASWCGHRRSSIAGANCGAECSLLEDAGRKIPVQLRSNLLSNHGWPRRLSIQFRLGLRRSPNQSGQRVTQTTCAGGVGARYHLVGDRVECGGEACSWGTRRAVEMLSFCWFLVRFDPSHLYVMLSCWAVYCRRLGLALELAFNAHPSHSSDRKIIHAPKETASFI